MFVRSPTCIGPRSVGLGRHRNLVGIGVDCCRRIVRIDHGRKTRQERGSMHFFG